MDTEKAVKEIISMLCGRGGFDDWWQNIDEDTQEDIKEIMEDIIQNS